MNEPMTTLQLDIVDDFTLRLKALVASAGSVSALAKKAGISHSGLLRYLGGGDPSRKVLVALAQAASVDLAWLATGHGEMTGGLPKQSLTMLPLYEGVAANDHAPPRIANTTLTELADGQVFLIEDCGTLLLRRIQLEVGGRVRLVADNPAYRSVDVARDGLTVLGSVVWSARLA